MAEDKNPPPPKPKGSCLGKLMALFSFAGVAGLGVAVFFITQPQDLSDIKGRPSGLTPPPKTRDLRTVLQNSVDRSYPLTLTEEEINLYLRQTLAAKQGGALGSQVSLDAVSVRIEVRGSPGIAPLCIERRCLSKAICSTSANCARSSPTMPLMGFCISPRIYW